MEPQGPELGKYWKQVLCKMVTAAWVSKGEIDVKNAINKGAVIENDIVIA